MSYSVFSVSISIVILFILVMFNLFRKTTPFLKNKIFNVGIYICFITSIFDLLALFFSKVHLPSNDLLSCLYYIGIGSTGIVFLMITIATIYNKIKLNKNIQCLIFVPFILFISSIILEYVSPNSFTFITMGFITNNFYKLLFINHFLYLLFSFLFVIFNFKEIRFSDKMFLFSYPTMVIINLFMELKYSTAHTTMLIVSIACLYMYLYVRTDEMKIDNDTKLYNKDEYLERMATLIKNKKTNYKSYLIKLNNISEIRNDIVQEEYLLKFVDDLKKTFTGKSIYRYNFSTFIVLDVSKVTIINNLLDNELLLKNYNELIYYQLVSDLRIKNIDDMKRIFNYFITDVKKFNISNQEIQNNIVDIKIKDDKIINIVRNAAITRDINVLYQPVVDIKTNKVVGAEALMRLNTRDFISPLDFIKIAEDINVIDELTCELLNKVGQFIEEINMSKKYKDFNGISVNLTPKQISSRDMQEYILKIIEKYRIEVGQLRLEITEDFISNENKEKILKIADNLKEKGILLYQDDFGTGYSDIRSLLDYGIPFNMIKVDKSLVDYIDTKDSKSYKFLESLIDSLHDLGYQIIVEGVERKTQLDILNEFNVGLVQGFYFSKPLDINNFKEFLNLNIIN